MTTHIHLNKKNGIQYSITTIPQGFRYIPRYSIVMNHDKQSREHVTKAGAFLCHINNSKQYPYSDLLQAGIPKESFIIIIRRDCITVMDDKSNTRDTQWL